MVYFTYKPTKMLVVVANKLASRFYLQTIDDVVVVANKLAVIFYLQILDYVSGSSK